MEIIHQKYRMDLNVNVRFFFNISLNSHRSIIFSLNPFASISFNAFFTSHKLVYQTIRNQTMKCINRAKIARTKKVLFSHHLYMLLANRGRIIGRYSEGTYYNKYFIYARDFIFSGIYDYCSAERLDLISIGFRLFSPSFG